MYSTMLSPIINFILLCCVNFLTIGTANEIGPEQSDYKRVEGKQWVRQILDYVEVEDEEHCIASCKENSQCTKATYWTEDYICFLYSEFQVCGLADDNRTVSFDFQPCGCDMKHNDFGTSSKKPNVVASYCESQWGFHYIPNGHCYLLFNQTKYWQDAYDDCVARAPKGQFATLNQCCALQLSLCSPH